MKIKEILQEAPLDATQEEDFLSAMKQSGYRRPFDALKAIDSRIGQLDSGAYADIYSLPSSEPHDSPGSDTVIKIARNDDGAIKYLTWCRRNQSNPHVPKLLGLHVSPDKKFLYARMEKLKPVTGKEYKWSSKDIPFLTYLKSQSLDTVRIDMNDIISKLLSRYGYSEYRHGAMGDIHSYTYHLDKISSRKKFNEFLNTIPEAASEIKQSWRTDPMVKALHYALNVLKRIDPDNNLDIEVRYYGIMHNIMQRPKTGELVVTDPLAGD